MDESQKHYAEQKKPYTKGYIFYDFIYINFQSKHNLSIVDKIRRVIVSKGIKIWINWEDA